MTVGRVFVCFVYPMLLPHGMGSISSAAAPAWWRRHLGYLECSPALILWPPFWISYLLHAAAAWRRRHLGFFAADRLRLCSRHFGFFVGLFFWAGLRQPVLFFSRYFIWSINPGADYDKLSVVLKIACMLEVSWVKTDQITFYRNILSY